MWIIFLILKVVVSKITVTTTAFFFIVYLVLVVLKLRCCMQAFSGCTEQGLFLVAEAGLPMAGGFSLRSSVSGTCGLSSRGAWGLNASQHVGSS